MWSIIITTIAVSKTSIACVLQATHGGGFKFKVKTKLFEFNNPLFYPTPFTVGYSGDLDAVPDVLEFLGNTEPTAKPPRNRNCEFVVLTKDHKIYTFINPTKWILVDEPNYAIGSGMHYALGALKAGATPKEAVKAACKLDPMSGLGVKEISYP